MRKYLLAGAAVAAVMRDYGLEDRAEAPQSPPEL